MCTLLSYVLCPSQGEGEELDWVSEKSSTDVYWDTYTETLYSVTAVSLTADVTVVAPVFHRHKGGLERKRLRRGEWGTKIRKCGRCQKMTTHNKRTCRVLCEDLSGRQDE